MKKCENCQEVISTDRPFYNNRKFCSKRCSRIKYGYLGNRLNLETGTLGAMSELIAAADLIARGYEVYRALSPSSKSDLVVIKDGVIKRVEVRTGYRYKTSHDLFFSKDRCHSDMFAVVVSPGVSAETEILYVPEL